MRYLIVSESKGIFLGGKSHQGNIIAVFADDKEFGYTSAITFEMEKIAAEICTDLSKYINDCSIKPINISTKRLYVTCEELIKHGFGSYIGNMFANIEPKFGTVH
jgi:hypothetical protein